jgi:hypothetical protein
MEYLIKQYPLETGALEIQYIEEYFGEFPRKKTAAEILSRLNDREFLILMAEAPLRDDPGTIVPVAFKIVHEIRRNESEPKLVDLVSRLDSSVVFEDRKVLYSWVGGTRRDWRGQGTSARSPRNRKCGRTPPAFTRSSSRRRTATTTCAARSINSSST